jgi:hypothetical protein
MQRALRANGRYRLSHARGAMILLALIGACIAAACGAGGGDSGSPGGATDPGATPGNPVTVTLSQSPGSAVGVVSNQPTSCGGAASCLVCANALMTAVVSAGSSAQSAAAIDSAVYVFTNLQDGSSVSIKRGDSVVKAMWPPYMIAGQTYHSGDNLFRPASFSVVRTLYYTSGMTAAKGSASTPVFTCQ